MHHVADWELAPNDMTNPGPVDVPSTGTLRRPGNSKFAQRRRLNNHYWLLGPVCLLMQDSLERR